MDNNKSDLLECVERAEVSVKDSERGLGAARAALDMAILDAVEAGATWVEVGAAAQATPNTVSKALKRARERRAGGGA